MAWNSSCTDIEDTTCSYIIDMSRVKTSFDQEQLSYNAQCHFDGGAAMLATQNAINAAMPKDKLQQRPMLHAPRLVKDSELTSFMQLEQQSTQRTKQRHSTKHKLIERIQQQLDSSNRNEMSTECNFPGCKVLDNPKYFQLPSAQVDHIVIIPHKHENKNAVIVPQGSLQHAITNKKHKRALNLFVQELNFTRHCPWTQPCAKYTGPLP